MVFTNWPLFVFGFTLLQRVTAIPDVPSSDIAPTASPSTGDEDEQDLYPDFSPGTMPRIPSVIPLSKGGLRGSGGRLEVRQSTCDPGYILACPLTEPRPCCPSTHPVCCTQNDGCCRSGYYCVGTPADPGCCPTGSIDCGSDCCPSGTTCCGSTCCRSGYTCVTGQCVNPLLSSMSVQSIASVQSVSSISSMSRASVASFSAAQASLSSALVTQSGYTNSATIVTAHVKPNDNRIKYEPSSAWFDGTSGTSSSSSSPVGTCTNGTKLTQTAGAKFTFVFEGTSISLDIVPSTAGGRFTVSLDNGPGSEYSSKSNGTSDECIAVQLVSLAGLQQSPHQIVVTNGLSSSGSSGGKLEFSGITYTGRGAFGTPEEGSSSGPSGAVIGGSVGGAVGAIAILGAGIFFYMRRRRRNGTGTTTTTPGHAAGGSTSAPGQMAQYQPGPENTITPYAIPGASPAASGHQSLPSQEHQSFVYPQQFPGQQGQYYQYGQPGTSQAAPLPMWVQRASQGNDPGSPPSRPADAVSMTSATNSMIHGPNSAYGGVANPTNQPNAFYGAHYAGNAQGFNPGRF